VIIDESGDVVGRITLHGISRGAGHELLVAVAAHSPDVVLTDLTMPGLGGLEALERLRGSAPDVGVIVLTMHEDDESVFAALRAGPGVTWSRAQTPRRS
jgi:DNA-binding NarL/FixJ family response regulator